jgi:TonB family protein
LVIERFRNEGKGYFAPREVLYRKVIYRVSSGLALSAITVDKKPRPLNRAYPQYTEEALRHKVEGAIIAQVLVGEDGLVKQVRIRRGLPHGLNDQAIRAAARLRFEPAMKDGKPVAYWVPIEVVFTIK